MPCLEAHFDSVQPTTWCGTQWPMCSVAHVVCAEEGSSFSGGSLTLNLTWSALGYWSWLQVSSEHAHPLIWTSIHHPLSTTHPHTLTEFTVQMTSSLSSGKLTSNLIMDIIRSLVMSHWVHSSVNSHDLWPVLYCGGAFSLCIRQLGLLRCVVKVLAIMCCHGVTSLKELVCVWLWVVVHYLCSVWGAVWVKTLCQYGMCHNAGYIINIWILSYIFVSYIYIYNYISKYIIYIWIYIINPDI